MEPLLDNKSALLTGAAKGIGEETAYCFAEHGIKALALVDRDTAGLDAVRARLQERFPDTQTLAFAGDVNDESDCISTVEKAVGAFGGLDILVNIAGVSRYSALDELTLADWDDMLGINLTGTFLYCREAFRSMKKAGKGGRIINIASVAPYVGGLTVGGHYVASKGGVIALSRHVAKVGAPLNILCNTVAPGTIDTDMIAGYSSDVSHIPLGHRGAARDVANAILFFASELSSFVTGQCLGVNGGISFQ
jgi:3-oxoacyl-[acyl-carrier protein] reductase